MKVLMLVGPKYGNTIARGGCWFSHITRVEVLAAFHAEYSTNGFRLVLGAR